MEKTYPSLPSQPTEWGQPFTLSYAIALQPLPPNTGMSLVVDVPGTTVANNAFWAEKCKTIPFKTLFIVVDMGAVRGYRCGQHSVNNSNIPNVMCSSKPQCFPLRFITTHAHTRARTHCLSYGTCLLSELHLC